MSSTTSSNIQFTFDTIWGTNCMPTMRHIVHEFLHTMGILHEQSRNDRDNFISVLTASITPEKRDQYAKASSYTVTSPYDFTSCMHYGAYSFSASGDRRII